MNDDRAIGPLDVETVREKWSMTYNREGKPDWSHIFPYYHPEIVFQDPIQRIEGFDAFRAMCGRLTGRCRQLRMELFEVIKEGNVIILEWKMTMMFRKFPGSSIFGCSRLTLHEDGRIIRQRDYYDLWGDIFDNVPGFRKAYRWFMRKFFG